jgi:YesN/AraC family two-component response regulator
MTFNVLIADDEFFIRQRLIKLIPWQKLNFNLAYEAENGMQVLDFLKQTPVHLVILDIQMPKMNGLEVIQYIDTHYPQTKVLILSGYNDFEYARQTLRYNAVDYLLKPVDPTHLEAVLITCKNKLEKDFQNQKALQHFTHYENQTFLCEVLQGMRTVDSLKQNFPVLKTTQISCYMSCYFAEFGLQTIIQLTDYLKSANLFCEYVKESENIYIVQVFFNTRDAYLTLVPSLQNFLSSIKTYHFIFIGESFAPEVSWKPYYKSNLKNIGMRYFYPGQSVLLASQLPEMKKSSHKLLSKIRLKITSFINTKNQEGLITYLES